MAETTPIYASELPERIWLGVSGSALRAGEAFVRADIYRAAVEVEAKRADAAEAKIRKLKRLDDDPWKWAGDGSDHLESLCCPILIEPDDLRALLAATSKPSVAVCDGAPEEGA